MERSAAALTTPTPETNCDTSSSLASTPTSTAFDQETQRQRSGATESWRQFIAWSLAISSFLYLLSFTNFSPWLWTSAPSTDAIFSSDLSRLSVTTSFQGTYLRGVFDGSTPHEQLENHKRIPRIIHQTYKTRDLPQAVQTLTASWRALNPDWAYYFYNDTDCLRFVEREFPEYLAAYKSLPKNVERSDFFRYMVVLRYGGIYADLDTECMISMDEIIQPEDSMVVGWECDTPSVDEAERRHFVRRRQLLQWVFAAEPGHPVLKKVCQFIAANAQRQLSNISSNHDTLEKTGPGIWTDVILKHIHQRNWDHGIRILPQVAFGSHPSGTDNIDPDASGILVHHHFLGSWKNHDWGMSKFRILESIFGISLISHQAIVKPAPVSFFPVHVNFTPSFSIMVHPSGEGSFVGGVDVSSMLTRWGVWQAGSVPLRTPRVVDVVAGSLGNAHMNLHLLDVGAGLGFFSLAAAARGHPVVAFESVTSNISPLSHSILANNFTNTLKLFTSIEELRTDVPSHCSSQSKKLGGAVMKTDLECLEPAPEAAGRLQKSCGPEIGALRIGYTGWSAWRRLRNEDYFHQFRPPIIVAEYSPWKIKESGWDHPSTFLNEMIERGYTEAYHTGELCQRRWEALCKHVTQYGHHEQPVWCNVSPSDFGIFSMIEDKEHVAPENLLFVKRGDKSESL